MTSVHNLHWGYITKVQDYGGNFQHQEKHEPTNTYQFGTVGMNTAATLL